MLEGVDKVVSGARKDSQSDEQFHGALRRDLLEIRIRLTPPIDDKVDLVKRACVLVVRQMKLEWSIVRGFILFTLRQCRFKSQ